MPVVHQKFITRQDLENNRDILYVFGDNDQRRGFGGQAIEMRGEINAIGVRTKKAPDNYAYYNDEEFFENTLKILEDILPLERHLAKGGTVIIPLDGIGTGLAKMKEKCPKTLEFLQRKLKYLETINVKKQKR